MNVSLPPAQRKLVTELVKSGKYASSSEVVREGLRLLVSKETGRDRPRTLRQEIQAGLDDIDRGDVLAVDDEGLDALFDEVKKIVKKRTAGRKSAKPKARA